MYVMYMYISPNPLSMYKQPPAPPSARRPTIKKSHLFKNKNSQNPLWYPIITRDKRAARPPSCLSAVVPSRTGRWASLGSDFTVQVFRARVRCEGERPWWAVEKGGKGEGDQAATATAILGAGPRISWAECLTMPPVTGRQVDFSR